jgi:hypothetical protein
MSYVLPRLIRLSLAAVLVFGGFIAHAGSVVHAASNGFGIAHGHVNTVKGASVPVQSGSIDLFVSDAGTDDPGHAPGFCIDAHCCTPAVHIAIHVLRHSVESGKLVFGPASNYALSVALSLLKPPRVIT